MKKNLRLLIAAILFAAVLLQTGCATVNSIADGENFGDVLNAASTDLFGESEQSCRDISVSLPRHPGYNVLTDKNAYNSLTTNAQREAYTAIEASLFSISDEWVDEFGGYAMRRALIPSLSSAEIFIVKEAVLADHPEAFWITGNYSIAANMRDGSFVTLYSGYSYNEIFTHMLALERSIIAIFKEIPSNRSEYERELAIHDILVRGLSYDTDAVAYADSYIDAATVYGALVENRAICTGYSHAFKLLCNRVGISCMTVKGTSKGEGHMWNVVKLDGYWYHVDVTWDDPIVAGSMDGSLSYDYLNLTDEDICLDHTIAAGFDELERILSQNPDYNDSAFYNFPLPSCTAVRYNFYQQNAINISDLSDNSADRIISLMKDARLSGDIYLYISFADNMDTQAVSDWLSTVIQDGISAVNSMADAADMPKVDHCELYIRSSSQPSPWQNVRTVRIVYDESENL